jgi:hypothetical protein
MLDCSSGIPYSIVPVASKPAHQISSIVQCAQSTQATTVFPEDYLKYAIIRPNNRFSKNIRKRKLIRQTHLL